MRSDTSGPVDNMDREKRPSSDGSTIVSAPADIDCEMLAVRVKARMRDKPIAPVLAGETRGEDSNPTMNGTREASRSAIPQRLGTRIPLIRHVWTQFRGILFDEIRTYMDGHFARQADVNQRLLETIAELRQEITDLRAAIEPAGPDGK